MEKQSALRQALVSFAYGVAGFWLSFAAVDLSFGILVAGAGRFFVVVGIPFAYLIWLLLLWGFGYLSHDRAPFPKILFSVAAFVINVKVYELMLNAIFPFFASIMQLDNDTIEQVMSPVSLTEATALAAQVFVLFGCGIGTSALLHLLKRSRVTRITRVQKGLLTLIGGSARLCGQLFVLFALAAYDGPAITVWHLSILRAAGRELAVSCDAHYAGSPKATNYRAPSYFVISASARSFDVLMHTFRLH